MNGLRARQSPGLAPREILFESGDLGAAEATVCITLHNYGAYIENALQSAAEQTLGPLGLVVLDDCSRDDGPARAERWLRGAAARFAGVCLARHRRNAGLARARNGTVDLAASEFVMILDADNALHPRCVERLAASLRAADPRFGFAYPIIERFGDHRGLMGTSSWDVELLRDENYVDAMALLRKETWQRVGGYDRMRIGGWEDFDFWCKCIEADLRGLFVPEILARYRVHGTSMLALETDRAKNALRVRHEMRKRHAWLRLGMVDSEEDDVRPGTASPVTARSDASRTARS